LGGGAAWDLPRPSVSRSLLAEPAVVDAAVPPPHARRRDRRRLRIVGGNAMAGPVISCHAGRRRQF
jgi:hypothetical protein